MKREFGFNTGSGTSMEKGLRFLEYPVFKFGTEKKEEIRISGREEMLTRRTGEYFDTVIENIVEVAVKKRMDAEVTRIQIESWLKKIKRLTYTDMEQMYFNVKKVEVESVRKHGVYEIMSITFVCDPGIYYHEGDREISLMPRQQIQNNYSLAKPIYKIAGEGVLTLKVNGKTVTANVGQNLTIDTDLMIAYRTDGTLQNTALTGRYEDLYLDAGSNIIEFGSGFKITLVPRWRLML